MSDNAPVRQEAEYAVSCTADANASRMRITVIVEGPIDGFDPTIVETELKRMHAAIRDDPERGQLR